MNLFSQSNYTLLICLILGLALAGTSAAHAQYPDPSQSPEPLRAAAVRDNIYRAIREGSVQELSKWIHYARDAKLGPPGADHIAQVMRAGIRIVHAGAGIPPRREDAYGVATRLKMIQILVEAGVDVNGRADYAQTSPVFDVNDQADASILDFLLNKGARTAATDFGQTGYPMIRSVLLTVLSWDDAKTVSQLLPKIIKAGADVNETLGRKRTVLMFMSQGGKADRVRWLIAQGATVNAVDAERHSALMTAASAGHRDIVQLLLKGGAEPNIKDVGGATALHYGARFPEIVRLLLSAGTDPNSTDLLGNTPLHSAAQIFYSYMYSSNPYTRELKAAENKLRLDAAVAIAELVKVGANVNARNQSGATPLHAAAIRETVHALVGAGANVDARNAYGYTPLLASPGKSPEVAIALSKRGAAPEAKTSDGEGYREIVAHRWGQHPLLKEMFDNVSNINAKDRDGRTVTHRALMNCSHGQLLQWLLSDGADPLAEDTVGDTPVHTWARNASHPGSAVCLAVLLDAGVALNRKNSRGISPLDVLTQSKSIHTEAGKMLDLKVTSPK